MYPVIKRDVNQAVNHYGYNDHSAENWQSEEKRKSQVSTLQKPCLLHPLPIIVSSSMAILYHSSVVLCRNIYLTKTPGMPDDVTRTFFGMWAPSLSFSPHRLYFQKTLLLKSCPQGLKFLDSFNFCNTIIPEEIHQFRGQCPYKTT